MSPLVTIIIPCYNSAPWVAQTIESALAQAGPTKEIILVNDGSRDNSLAIARGYASRGVTVIDQPNRGASAARNTGLEVARGEFIQFLDADDLLAPGKLARQVSLLQVQGTNAVATARWARFLADPATAVVTESPLFQDLSPVDFLLLHTSGAYMMHPAAWLMPAAVTRRAGPWDGSLSLNDDGEYFSRVVLAAEKIVHDPESLTLYRSNLPTSLSGRRDRRSLESLYHSYDLVAAHLRAAENSPRIQCALADYYQRLAYEVYPDAPDLSRRAQAEAKALGGSSVPAPMGARQARLARLIGWRLAKRAARYLSR